MSWPTVRIKCYLYLLQKQDNGGDLLWPSFLDGEEGLWGADKDLGFPVLDIPLMTQDLEDPLTAVNVCPCKGRPGVGGGALVPVNRRQTIIIQYIKHQFRNWKFKNISTDFMQILISPVLYGINGNCTVGVHQRHYNCSLPLEEPDIWDPEGEASTSDADILH